MSSFWNFVTQMVSGTLARAEDVNTNLSGIDTGFSLVETELAKCIQVTNSPGTVDIGENAAARASTTIGFDASGNIVLTPNSVSFVSGVITENSLVAAGNTSVVSPNIITHGLGTDDIDFGGTIYSSDTFPDGANSTAIMVGYNKEVVLIGYGPSLPTIAASKAGTGTIKVLFHNGGPNTANLSLRWWARKRT